MYYINNCLLYTSIGGYRGRCCRSGCDYAVLYTLQNQFSPGLALDCKAVMEKQNV